MCSQNCHGGPGQSQLCLATQRTAQATVVSKSEKSKKSPGEMSVFSKLEVKMEHPDEKRRESGDWLTENKTSRQLGTCNWLLNLRGENKIF